MQCKYTNVVFYVMTENYGGKHKHKRHISHSDFLTSADNGHKTRLREAIYLWDAVTENLSENTIDIVPFIYIYKVPS